jgi:3-methylcrotonyl-CoA carboxylase alpha subunit
MFSSLLIANRGEIACRVMRTARRMGLRTIAVYSDADAGAMHVQMADLAVRIGPPPARESYLKIETIIEAARAAGAQAIHPGYGFLSENAEFAEACEKDGINFVGPPASAIRAMGLKDAAKALMSKAGVPVVPGYHGADQDGCELAKHAKDVGYPILIKAVAGGGGKGMRRVETASEFEKALEGAKREAASAFGDDRVLIEKYVTRPRHIEMQVFADSHSNAVHLFERDCSLQRRHQKVIEEAPAPGMTAELRSLMGEAAVKAAKAIGYRGAGTVEFIADSSKGLRPDGFFFMEMNTRLQVEHPVTEMITGLDLVEWQLRVASGEKLPLAQSQLAIRGHAIEARLYAEDPAKNFLPSTGKLHRLRLPKADTHVRVDTGVREGDEVSMFYDPMIAKIIVHDATREEACRNLTRAMETVEVVGVKANAAFIAACAGNSAFVSGDIDTDFIDKNLGQLAPKNDGVPPGVLALGALAVLLKQRQVAREKASAGREPWSPWAELDGFRIGRDGHGVVEFVDGGKPISVPVTYLKDGYRLDVGGEPQLASGELTNDGTLNAIVNGARVSAGAVQFDKSIALTLRGASYSLSLFDPLDVDEAGESAGTALTAPMPGKIVQVLAKPGDRVKKGQALVILEAMKMEHTLSAPSDRVIEAVRVSAGDQVTEGALVVTFKQDA